MPIWEESRRRWEQLESDEVLAAPWRQLFCQVKSPDHVISELLQNADDAGATWVRANIEGSLFCFEHNGQDFEQSSLESLCRFGFSNKRHLHTIGFRGIGFKSTFSLGSRVEVWTPSIAIAFEEARFTKPVWLDDAPYTAHTQIRVSIEQKERIQWLHSNLRHWAESAVPILFFQNIQQLELQGKRISKVSQGHGPIPNSEWIDLQAEETQRVLRIFSPEEDFPDSAIREIRQERGSTDLELPPCHVELILGLRRDQRLYVVLPTGVRPNLPFSCNAPFIQDPARTSIKDPVASPTNQWLLQRIAKLAAQTMLTWLENQELSLDERANAYNLLPEEPVNESETIDLINDLGCTNRIVNEFTKSLGNSSLLLEESGQLTDKSECWSIPAQLLNIWEAPILSDWLNASSGENKTYILAQNISNNKRQKLQKWRWIDEFSINTFITFLEREPYPPRPSIEGLRKLWSIVSSTLPRYSFIRTYSSKSWAIAPVHSKSKLYPVERVSVIGRQDPRLTEADWQFLIGNVLVLDPSWVERIREEDKSNDESGSDLSSPSPERQEWENVSWLLQQSGLQGSYSLESLIQSVAGRLSYDQTEQSKQAGVWLAKITAKANIQIPSSLLYFCQDSSWRSQSDYLLAGSPVELENLLPQKWAEQRTIHNDYEAGFSASDLQIWREWKKSSKSKLLFFPLPTKNECLLTSRTNLRSFCEEHRGQAPDEYPKQTDKFITLDYDFEVELWDYWEIQYQDNLKIWIFIVRAIAISWNDEWQSYCKASVRQKTTGMKSYPLDCGTLTAKWLVQLRDLPCIPDRYSKPCFPQTLYRVTAYTVALQGVEPFIHPDYDRPEYSEYLDYLGVQSTPANADRLIERLVALAKASPPPLESLLGIYNALDQVILWLPTDELARIQTVFAKKRLIFAEDGTWQRQDGVFRSNPQQIPGGVIVHPGTVHLNLWRLLQVAEQPTLELAIEWLANLPVPFTPDSTDRARIRTVIQQAALSVWNEVGCWLNTDGQWVPTNNLRWRVRELAVSELYVTLKREIADLSMFSISEREKVPFRELEWLDAAIEMRITEVDLVSCAISPPDWLQALSTCMLRIMPNSFQETTAILSTGGDRHHSQHQSNMQAATRLQRTQWQTVRTLAIQPYLEGSPVGTLQRPQVLWDEETFYVKGKGAQYHKDLVQELGTKFNGGRLREAIAACVERDPSWVQTYFEANFSLNTDPVTSIPSPTAKSIDLPNQNAGTPVPIRITAPDNNNEPFSPPTPNSSPRRLRVDIFRQWVENSQGFRWEEDRQQFIHEDGCSIQKAFREEIVHWIRYDKSGDPIDWYWVQHKSIRDGVEIPSEVWERMRKKPDRCWFVVLDEEDAIQAYRQDQLQKWNQSGKMHFSPATYRLRLNEYG